MNKRVCDLCGKDAYPQLRSTSVCYQSAKGETIKIGMVIEHTEFGDGYRRDLDFCRDCEDGLLNEFIRLQCTALDRDKKLKGGHHYPVTMDEVQNA